MRSKVNYIQFGAKSCDVGLESAAWCLDFPERQTNLPLTGSPYVSLVDVFNSDNLTAFITNLSHILFAFISVHNNLRRSSILATP